MKKLNLLGSTLLVLFFMSCSKSSIEKGTPQASDMGGSENSQNTNAGVITASEWNDLNNWDFWNNLMSKSENAKMQSSWGFFTSNRFSVIVKDKDLKLVCDAKVALVNNGETLFVAKTDNKGKAELWANLNSSNNLVDVTKCQISINDGEKVISQVKRYADGINTVTLDGAWENSKVANVSFVIDATSSMADELKYLKNELYDVIDRIKNNNPQSTVYSSVVFYKDNGDDYVTKKSNFTSDNNTSINFLKNEETNGGGDYPEAVHSALEVAVNDLTWSEKAKTRIIFLILDAPPHNSANVISSLQVSVKKAAEKGIKLIPVIASGADKDTEFSVRLMSMSTNGTFVFITDDSKKGNKHYEPSVGTYQVEFLNNLMVRLVNANMQ